MRGRTPLTAAQQIEIKIYVHMFEFIARLWLPAIAIPPSGANSRDPGIQGDRRTGGLRSGHRLRILRVAPACVCKCYSIECEIIWALALHS